MDAILVFDYCELFCCGVMPRSSAVMPFVPICCEVVAGGLHRWVHAIALLNSAAKPGVGTSCQNLLFAATLLDPRFGALVALGGSQSCKTLWEQGDIDHDQTTHLGKEHRRSPIFIA